MSQKKRVGVIGGRGFVGQELLALLENDPTLEVAFVVSKGAAGSQLRGHELKDLSPADVTRIHGDGGVDAVVFGLQNGQSPEWIAALPAALPVVDLSADWRFDDRWMYGLVEKNREALRGHKRIANPGCYSTAAGLAIAAFSDLAERAHVFGISGYSGAGAAPSRKNDVSLLADNLLPYDLIGHTQEREMTRHAGVDVRFMPHVAPFFRGITCTIALDLHASIAEADARQRLADRYRAEPLVVVTDDEPLVKDVRARHGVIIGGVRSTSHEGRHRLVVVSVIDNLLKGAATQALQNVHLALGLDELSGIPTGTP